MTGNNESSRNAATSLARSPWPHRMALLVVALTIPLIFMGGKVTSTGAGMAVPDWPTTYGHNMLTFPTSEWVGAIYTEHTHRLAGFIVGCATILLTVTFVLRDARTWAKWFGGLALVLVSGQGVLGGLRVKLYAQWLAPVHGCVAQACFAFFVALVFLTSKGWHESVALPSLRANRARKLTIAAAAVAYLQVILGAWYRHNAGARVEPHALNAFVLLALVILAVREVKEVPGLARIGRVLHGLLGAQIALGLWALATKWTDTISTDAKVIQTSLHLVLGALTLGTTVGLALRTWKELLPATSSSPKTDSKTEKPEPALVESVA